MPPHHAGDPEDERQRTKMMIARIDEWLGLRVFQPPAILLCWLLRVTQWRLHRDMWFLFSVENLWANRNSGWLTITMLVIFSIFFLLSAALMPPSMRASSMRWFRLLVTFDLTLTVVTMNWHHSLEDVWLLLAEYAATITDLPPPPAFKRRQRMKESYNAS